eukprot:EG_transcript_58398
MWACATLCPDVSKCDSHDQFAISLTALLFRSQRTIVLTFLCVKLFGPVLLLCGMGRSPPALLSPTALPFSLAVAVARFATLPCSGGSICVCERQREPRPPACQPP